MINKEKDSINNKIKRSIINREILQFLPISFIFILLVIPFFIFLVVNLCYEDQGLGYPILHFNINNILSVFSFARYFIIRDTIILSIVSAILATFLGYFLSFFITFLRTSIKNYIIVLAYVPFFFNPISQFYAIKSLFLTTGVFNNLLISLNIIDSYIIVPEYFIISLSLIIRYLPIAFFLTSILMQRISIAQIEASIDLGATRTRIFYDFIFKRTYKSIIISLFIIFILCYGNISSSLLTDCNLFGNNFINFLLLGDTLSASAYLFFFGIFTCIAIILCNIYFHKSNFFVVREQAMNLSKYKCLDIAKSPFTIIINIITIFLLFVIVFFTFLFSFNKVSSVFSFQGFSLRWYLDFFRDLNILVAFKNSFIVATFASIIATFIGSIFAISFSKYRQLINIKFLRIIKLPMLFSEVIFCASIIIFIKFVGLENDFLAQIIGISIVSLFISILLIYRQVRNFDLNMEAASLDLGANYIQTFKYVIVPTIFPSVISCFLLIFVYAFNEFIISYTISNSLSTPFISNWLFWLTKYQQTPVINVISSFILFLSFFIIYVADINNSHNEKSKKLKYYTLCFILIFAILFLIFG